MYSDGKKGQMLHSSQLVIFCLFVSVYFLAGTMLFLPQDILDISLYFCTSCCKKGKHRKKLSTSAFYFPGIYKNLPCPSCMQHWVSLLYFLIISICVFFHLGILLQGSKTTFPCRPGELHLEYRDGVGSPSICWVESG